MDLHMLSMNSLLDNLSQALIDIGAVTKEGALSGNDSHAQVGVKVGKTSTTLSLDKANDAITLSLSHSKDCVITCDFADKFFSPSEIMIFFFNRFNTYFDSDGFVDKEKSEYVMSVETMLLHKVFDKARSDSGVRTNQQIADMADNGEFEQLLIATHNTVVVPSMQIQYGSSTNLMLALTGYRPFTVSLLMYENMVCGYRFHSVIQGINCYYDVTSTVAEKEGVFNLVISGEEELHEYHGEFLSMREISGDIKCRNISGCPEMVRYLICLCLSNNRG